MNTTPPATEVAPIDAFSRCHDGIVQQLGQLADLPPLVEAAARAQQIAQSTVALFQKGVYVHHREEEEELFPAVLRSATPGNEQALVQVMVDRLTQEHRQIEALWERLSDGLAAAAKGKPAELDGRAVARLVNDYLEHARFEESDFLPLAAKILGRNGDHMAALGLSLHMRHQPLVVGHI